MYGHNRVSLTSFSENPVRSYPNYGNSSEDEKNYATFATTYKRDMRKERICILAGWFIALSATHAETSKDSIAGHELHPVVVTGVRGATDSRHLPMTVSVLDRDVLTAKYQFSPLPVVTEQVPGLFITSRGVLGYGVSTGAAGGIKVRGVGSMAQMLVLIDGQPQYAGLMGHPIADAYSTMMAEKVEVLRGPASLLYGSNAMGGVMNIVTRQVKTEGSKTNAQLEGGSYGTFQGQISHQMKKKNFSATVGAGYSRTDGHRENSEFEQFSGFLKMGYDFSPHWKVTGDLSLTRFNASNPGEETNPYIDNDSRITRGLASLQVANNFDGMSGAVRVFYDWGHHRINDGYHPNGTPQTQWYLHNDLMSGVCAYETISLFSGNHTTVGFDYQHFGGRAWNRGMVNHEQKELIDKTQEEWGAYADFRQDIASWLTMDAGVRMDHHSHTGMEWVPQGGLTFSFSRESQMRAMVSKGFRNPTIREMYMFKPKNNALYPERMMNYELAFSNNMLDNSLHVGLNVFYLKAANLINLEMVDGRSQWMNTGKLENSGVELELRYRVSSNWNLNANYSYLHTSKPVTGAPRNKFFLGVDYQKKRLSVNTGVQYVEGLTLTTSSDATGECFALWNLTASYKICQLAKVYVRGENLLAQRYETIKGFPMPRTTVMGGIHFDF